MGLGVDTQAVFLLMSIPAGAGLGLTWSYASVVTQAVAPPDKAGGASGVVLTVLIGFAGVAVAVASSALSTGTGTTRNVIGTTLIAFGVLAIAVVPLVTVFGRGKPAIS